MPNYELNLPPGWYVRHWDVTDSTMLRLRSDELSGRTEEFVLATAGFQTAGRGQKGTFWESAPDQNLLFGFIFHPESIPASRQFALSEALALAVADTLSQYISSVCIKWPNDIYWEDRKICGMLLEHDLCGSHIATTLTGVGLNVNQEIFKSDAPNPVSLRQITGTEIAAGQLLQHILCQFTAYYRLLQKGQYSLVHRHYMERLYRRNGLHSYRDRNGTFQAEITDISPLGVLTLRRPDGSLHHYAFKELSYLIPDRPVPGTDRDPSLL